MGIFRQEAARGSPHLSPEKDSSKSRGELLPLLMPSLIFGAVQEKQLQLDLDRTWPSLRALDTQVLPFMEVLRHCTFTHSPFA